MDRQIPDVWNIFSLSGPKSMDEARRGRLEIGQHVNWSQRNQDLLMKWCDRSSVCDRPRTYDKFYQRTPGNFFDPTHVDSAISVCSSEEEVDGYDRTTKKDKKKKKRTKDVSRTITERDVRHLERHLSMKKTIRKKIMRDLQQAFVDDPSKFQKDPVETHIDLNSLNFDPNSHHPSDQKFLDLLRDSDDSGHASPSATEDSATPDMAKYPGYSGTGSQGRHQKFRSVRERSKSTPRVAIVSDSSSCGGYESAESDQCKWEDLRQRTTERSLQELKIQDEENEIRRVSKTEECPADKLPITSTKKSFWKLLTGNSKKKGNGPKQ